MKVEDGFERFYGESVTVTPREGDTFHEFVGTVTGSRNGLLQVRDQDDNMFDVELCQVSVE